MSRITEYLQIEATKQVTNCTKFLILGSGISNKKFVISKKTSSSLN